MQIFKPVFQLLFVVILVMPAGAMAKSNGIGKLCWNGQPQWNVDLQSGGVAINTTNGARGAWSGGGDVVHLVMPHSHLTITRQADGTYIGYNDIGSMTG